MSKLPLQRALFPKAAGRGDVSTVATLGRDHHRRPGDLARWPGTHTWLLREGLALATAPSSMLPAQ